MLQRMEALNTLEKNYPEFILIQNKKNLGFAAAINQGINLPKPNMFFS